MKIQYRYLKVVGCSEKPLTDVNVLLKWQELRKQFVRALLYYFRYISRRRKKDLKKN